MNNKINLNNITSVIIVNWNGEKFLERCLTSLMSQTVTPREVILVDNASSDRSNEIAQRFPSIRIISLDQNTGFARGNNLALETASKKSAWIALINPDAFAEPRWLEELLASAERNPAVSVFASQLVKAGNPSVLDGAGDAYHVSGRFWRKGYGMPVSAAPENECEVFSPCAAAALYRHSALHEAGGFDEDYFCYVEDVDLGFRLRLAGHHCLYVPRAVVHHIGSGTTGGQHSDFALYHGHRNLVWTFVKDMPGILFWLLLPLHVMLNLVSILWFAFQGRSRVILRAKRDAGLGLPKMWRKRRSIQKARIASVVTLWRQLDKRMITTKSGRKKI